MKLCHSFLIISTFFICSCSKQKENNMYSSSTNVESKNNFETKSSAKKNSTKKLKLHKINNQQFKMIFGVMPIPSTWKVVNNKKDNIMFEAPNGTKIYGERFNTFYYSNNDQLNYISQQNGSQIKAPKDINRVLNEDFKPYLESNGLKYLRQFPLPQLATADKQLDNLMFKSTPEEKKYECIVTEWEDKNGNKSLGIIRYFTCYYPTIGGMNWGYTLNALEAPKLVYENAKEDYINALLNLQVNPNWLQKNNQYYAQISRQSNASHQQRMADIRKQGQAIINNGKTYSSILDSSHESWKRRNTMTDVGQSKSVDAVWERSNMSNQNGNQYQVEGYYNNVWKNDNNEYVATDNTNWNPNVDNTTNGINWDKLEYTDDNN